MVRGIVNFINVDLNVSLELCVSFRRDAHIVSYGCDDDFNEKEVKAWFARLSAKDPSGFQHVMIDGNIIGLLEFKSGLEGDDGVKRGYVNLFYLVPECRGLGYGEKIQHYVLSKFIEEGCVEANLRYIPRNKVAGAFYRKHQWTRVGNESERGQLMVKKLA